MIRKDFETALESRTINRIMTAEIRIAIPEGAVVKDGHLVFVIAAGETIRMKAQHLRFNVDAITQTKFRELECTVRGVRLI